MTSPAPELQTDGIWLSLHDDRPTLAGRPALFLDRDGVLVEEVGYLCKAADVRLLSGAGDLVRRANANQVPVVVVTNQAGIGRGYYDWSAFRAVQQRLEELLGREGAHCDAVVACPFHPDGRPPYRHPNHPCRKPNPGMLHRAAEPMRLDLKRSWMVADTLTDLEAARAASLEGGVHVLTGHGDRDRPKVTELDGIAVRLVRTLDEAPRCLPLLRDDGTLISGAR